MTFSILLNACPELSHHQFQQNNCNLQVYSPLLKFMAFLPSVLQYCAGMTDQDLSHAACFLFIASIYKKCLFPFRHSPDSI